MPPVPPIFVVFYSSTYPSSSFCRSPPHHNHFTHFQDSEHFEIGDTVKTSGMLSPYISTLYVCRTAYAKSRWVGRSIVCKINSFWGELPPSVQMPVWLTFSLYCCFLCLVPHLHHASLYIIDPYMTFSNLSFEILFLLGGGEVVSNKLFRDKKWILKYNGRVINGNRSPPHPPSQTNCIKYTYWNE